MKIQHEQKGVKGSFYINLKGVRVAEMTYRIPSADKMIIDHTEVNASLRGKHAGNNLLTEAVNYARTHSMKIVPVCGFVKAAFEKQPAIGDVLD